MILHQVQRTDKMIVRRNENLEVRAALLIAEQLILETPISHFIKSYYFLFYEINEADYLNSRIMHAPFGSQEREIYSNMLRVLTQTTPQHLIDEVVLKAYVALRDELVKIRREHKEHNEKIMKNFKLEQLMKFFDNRRILEQPVKIFDDNSNDEDPYIEWLRNILCNSAEIPLLTIKNEEYTDRIDWETLKNIEDIEQLPGYISIPLYRFPDISELTYEQLNRTRKNILEKINIFNKRIVELRKACSILTYEPSSCEVLRSTITEKLFGFEQLQHYIDEEIYIQNILNQENKRYVEINLGIASMEIIAGFFGYSGTLLPYVTEVLKERIDKTHGLQRCCLFYNIAVVDTEVDKMDE
jgi:hypothetical protein